MPSLKQNNSVTNVDQKNIVKNNESQMNNFQVSKSFEDEMEM